VRDEFFSLGTEEELDEEVDASPRDDAAGGGGEDEEAEGKSWTDPSSLEEDGQGFARASDRAAPRSRLLGRVAALAAAALLVAGLGWILVHRGQRAQPTRPTAGPGGASMHHRPAPRVYRGSARTAAPRFPAYRTYDHRSRPSAQRRARPRPPHEAVVRASSPTSRPRTATSQAAAAPTTTVIAAAASPVPQPVATTPPAAVATASRPPAPGPAPIPPPTTRDATAGDVVREFGP
jgi:hypothetical protein